MAAAVGVLGIGRMGGAMARRLSAAGLEVVCWNRTPAVARDLAAELGGRAVDRPADVAAAADVCITMLADGRAVEAVFGGPDGLIAGARPGNVLVDSSTVPPSTIRGLQAAAQSAGAGLLDAPVSGSVTLALAGQLTLIVGGEPDDLERARPVLDALARTVFHMGRLGSGAAMKLAVNTVIYGLNEALAEGLVLAEAAGIDLPKAYDVLAASVVGAPYVGYKREAFLSPATTPPVFARDLAVKDLRLIADLAREVGVPTPQAAVNLDVILAASTGGRGDRDFSTVADHLRESARTEEDRPA
jgi:3-hydroxyisobutyrate dehydrogenase-like beta-hydroxyacid dehydrogenase